MCLKVLFYSHCLVNVYDYNKKRQKSIYIYAVICFYLQPVRGRHAWYSQNALKKMIYFLNEAVKCW